MSIMSAKYKAHKLVNLVFYIIVFVFGFLVGIGAKKININNILSKVLMIDNINAYSFGTISGSDVDEDYIYNIFTDKYSDFDIDTYSNIFCSKRMANSIVYLDCYAMDNTSASEFYYAGASGSWWMWRFTGNTTQAPTMMKSFSLRMSNGRITTPASSTLPAGQHVNVYMGANSTNATYSSASNFDITSANVNVLDFSSYQTPLSLTYDEDLFTDDSNFKQVCVNNYDTFSITSKEIQDYDDNDNPLYHSNDFIWFKNGVKGISTWLYDSEEETHVTVFEQQEDGYLSSPYGWYFWFNSVDEINTYWNSPNSPGLELVTNGYTDKYKYYNYTAYPFFMTFTESYHRYQVFWFRDPYIEYLDGTIVDDSNQYCFYIKNEYDVNILNKNENGDLYGDITVLGDETFSDKTYKNELDKDVDGLFSTIVNFISRIRSTVNFINFNILNLYASMPLIVRMFIMSLLTLLVVRILIGMVIR